MYGLKLQIVRSKSRLVDHEEMRFIPMHYYRLEYFYDSPVYQYLHHEGGGLYLIDIDTGECLTAGYESQNELDCIRERFTEVELCS
jgi:hypothetical protein